MTLGLFEVSLILGVQRRDILGWIQEGRLKATKLGKLTHIRQTDLADFLFENPECVGRIYCEDSIPLHNDIRRELVQRIEEARKSCYT